MKEIKQVLQITISVDQLRELISEETKKVVDQFKKEESGKDLPEWMTQKEVAKFYGVSRQTVHNWEKENLIKRSIVGGITKFSKKEVLALQNNK